MTITPVAEMLENVGLSEDDFCYDINSDVYYHWSGFYLTVDTLLLSRAGDLKAEINKYLSSLTDKEERLEKFNLYKEHYEFIRDFKSWLLDKIIEESGVNNLTDFEERRDVYKAKRREYINGWEQGKQWCAHDLTDDTTKIPTALRQKAIEAWDYVVAHRDTYFFLRKALIHKGK